MGDREVRVGRGGPRAGGGAVLAAVSVVLVACGHQGGADLEVVRRLDLQRYVGTWYEIASAPMSPQEGCVDTRATYGLERDGTLSVTNECRDGIGGELRSAEGTAWMNDPEVPAKLQVQFFWPFQGSYWVLELDPDYDWALVGTPDREHAWILARGPRLDEGIVARLVERLRRDGYPVEQLRRTLHPSGSSIVSGERR